MKNESAIQLWNEFKKVNPNAPSDYDVWAFGDSKEMADDLANLVLKGIKTATASNYILYDLENESYPYPGLHNIILDGDAEAVAIIETTAVVVVPFDEVTEEHAFLEGEGDRSLNYWREVHETFFNKEFEAIEQEFNDNMLVVCERFNLVFTKESSIEN
ncbi:ASCH domain-containing protein [Pseudogracilibacillus sp. SO30301A]|uniref:ASCH domain-containing protein n=1 Tax=Pseudogracilibacillus sp. SO30301A TaxID=3098291 RepID=UPI00300E46A5